MSLDQCADQYVLNLAPEAELALSPRADDEDSWSRDRARHHRLVKPSLEAALAFQPDVVVSYWGGEPRLFKALERRGVRVLTIEDATDMEGVKRNVAHIAVGLNQDQRGQELIARMQAQLADARGAGQGRPILYVTPGGYTGGKGTLIDAILTSAGFSNAADGQGFVPIGVESLIFKPPALVVRGFYTLWRSNWRAPGRHPVVRKLSQGRTITDLSATTLSCPAWFAAEASAQLAEAAR
jgi:iron complex transport system substrate-binding protein